MVRFEVENYQVTLGMDLPNIITNVDVKIVGIIGCYGKGYQLIINFVQEGIALPKPVYNEQKKTGTIFVPSSMFANYLDLLRNEKPIFAYCNGDRPEWSNISTTNEPVGEGERR